MFAVVFIVAAILGGGSTTGGRARAPRRTGASHAPEARPRPAAQTPNELGYPAFATNNTTRVGGGDAASNAAGVALAVYPSTDEAQRPAR